MVHSTNPERLTEPILTEELNVSDTESNFHGGHGGTIFLKAGRLPAAVYTLCSISLGVGVFLLPLVMKSMGLITGTIALLVFGWWAYWCQMQLIDASLKFQPPIYSYEDLAETAFGSFGKAALAFFMAFNLLVGNAAHMKTVVHLLRDLLQWFVSGEYGDSSFSRTKFMALYVILLLIALAFCTGSRLNALRHASSASVSVVLILCVWCTGECMFWYWPKGQHEFSSHHAVSLASGNWRDYAANLPAIAFTFSGTFCLFPVFKELEVRSYENIHSAVFWSTVVCCLGYLIVSVIGVLTFGDRVDHDPFADKSALNYLYVFPPDHYVITCLCFVLVITITLLYPVINFPMLQSIEKFVEVFPVPASLDFKTAFLEWRYHRFLLTVLGMVFVVFLDLVFSNLVELFGFCGGWGVGFVVYIIPSCIYLKVCKDDPFLKRAAVFVSICAMLVVIISFTYVTFA